MRKIIEFKNVSFKYPKTNNFIFQDLNLALPQGFVSLIGENGTGKSTLLLLAGARLLPNKGQILIHGKDTKELQDETKKNEYASFIYQNLEFETKEDIGSLLEFVYKNGFHEHKESNFIKFLIDTFELGNLLKKRTQEVSKGELQRVILAFSLLYGSKIVMMDEPIFALEDYQKDKAMKFLQEYVCEHNLSIYYSVHELDISRKYSDYIVLFYKNSPPFIDSTEKIFNSKIIEEAYNVPIQFLKRREMLYRNMLKQST